MALSDLRSDVIKSAEGRPHSAPPLRLVFVIATAVLLALAGPASADGSGSSYAARPAPGPGDRSAGRFDLTVGAGSSASDAVEIFNYTDAPATFAIYAADVVRTTAGSLAPAAREQPITGPGSWIRIPDATVDVPPRSSVTVAFTVSVPDAAVLGRSTAALLVEPQKDRTGGTVAAITRVGLWVNIDVTAGVPGQGGTSPTSPILWIALAVVLLVAFLIWLAYVTRGRRRQWLAERREERDAVDAVRARRRHGGSSQHHA